MTGGTGFIGSYFIAEALNAGYSVKALRRSVRSSTSIPLAVQPDWLNRSLLDIEPGDMAGSDVLVHLATAGVSPRKASWNELVDINVKGTARLIDTARIAGLDKVIIAGTSHEYGATAYKVTPIPASAALEPLNLYGASKAAAYHLAAAYARDYGTKLYYGRIFSVYGEGQFHKNFWPSLRLAALSGEDFRMSSGVQIRDFIRVQEVARKLLRSCMRFDIARGHPLVENIASGRPLTLLDFARSEWERFKAKGRLLPGELSDRADEAPQIVAEIPDE